MGRFSIISVISLVLICGLWSRTQAELFTAISDVEPLLETHKRIIDDLDDYIQKEEKRIFVLKHHLNTYKREHEKAIEDIPNYLGNPLNAFTLIKRLTTDLDDIEKSIKKGTEYIKNITMTHSDVKYPTLEDLSGAANALTRLQKTYDLNVNDLAEGILNGVRYSSPMSAGDCYELGRALYNDQDYTNALAWMMQALNKFRETNETYNFQEVDILEYISFSHYMLDNIREALVWTRKLLALEPNHIRAKDNVPHYTKMIADESERLKKQRRGETGHRDDDKRPPKAYVPVTLSMQERQIYENLCRGEMEISPVIASKLTCRYLTENHPFLKLAPIKAEQRYIDPDVFVFYDVMSDHEIELVKDMAKPRFKRAVVHDPKSGQLVPAHYRISKSGWLRDEESPVIAKISQRVADFTGLTMATAEELQVVNYGIGGHYEPHFDFARKTENAFTEFSGNRIATVLFYMSEVAQGGATVFTELGLSVFPVKNAALFWLNLHPSGEGDIATRHAACPVLRGSKWVSNKWLHQGGQELVRPCNLEYQRETDLRRLPPAVHTTMR